MKLICYFDGGFKCAKKEMSWAFIIKNEKEEIIKQKQGIKKGNICTSNLAEFLALEELLTDLLEFEGLSSIEIYGDCKNLIDQMNKESKVKPPHLKEVYIRCLEKIDQLDIEDISFSWISRENNNACDRLMR
jgi:ribonuclease HI